MSLFRSPKLHRTHRAGRTSRLEPLLRREGLHGACVYYDCATDDGRLTLETALDAERHGAILLTHARAERLLRIDERMSGVRVRSELDPTRALDVATRTVVVAAGPWTDVVRNRPTPVLRPTKGVHIVVDAARLPLRQAVVMLHPRDGRVMFAVPWGDRAYVGTTDTDSLGDPNDVFATRDDVAYCLEAARWHFPDANLGEDDVISTWAALRPLLSQGDADHPSQTSREHAVLVDPDGLISIVGGKLTTYRRMAIDAVEAACAHLGRARGEAARAATATAPLLGGEGLDERGLAALEQELNELARGWLTVETARLFAATYGARAKEIALRVGAHRELGEPFCPGRPEAWIQVDWACEREQAETLCDVLMRRTTVFLRAEDQGLGCCEAVAGRMARILGWDGARLAKEINRYRAEVERSRRWREGPEPELDAAPVARG